MQPLPKPSLMTTILTTSFPAATAENVSLARNSSRPQESAADAVARQAATSFDDRIAGKGRLRGNYLCTSENKRWARLRIRMTYLFRHGRLPRLDEPILFTELVQHRKLHWADPSLPALIDKVSVKEFVAERLGRDWITPTLWSGEVLPEAPLWPYPFVLKSRHGCNQRRFFRSELDDWDAARGASARWIRHNYGWWLDETGYRSIPRGLLVESFAGDGSALPTDYKLYVFHGRVAFIQIHLDREHNHRWIVFDRGWRRCSSPTTDPDPSPPATLNRMIEGAEALAHDLDFVRIDFYEIDGRPRFGEMTFYPGSGLDPFDPAELDIIMGALWLSAPDKLAIDSGA